MSEPDDKAKRPGADAVRAALAAARPVNDDTKVEPKPRTPRKPKSRRAVSHDGEGAGGGGFDLGAMSGYSMVQFGSSVMIAAERGDGPHDDRITFMSPAAFKLRFANKFIGKRTAADAWLASPGRRDYEGVEFFPDPYDAPGTPGYLNLWRGLPVKPRQKAGAYSTFEDHLLTNVCGGDTRLYTWVFGWFAHLFQRPRERPGTALVLRGPQGAGKTKIGEVFGSLLGPYYSLVSDPRYVVGQFNAHHAKCLLLQADEAVWAGDKKAEGRLKSLVTELHQMIEHKGVDAVQMPNYIRLIMTSNEGWVVPAGKDERRFNVLDVGSSAAQNHGYFAEIDAQMDSGGREALLHDLLAFDLSRVNVRSIPRTGALLEQKVRSLDSVDGWWLERLTAGMTTHKHDRWQRSVACESLFDDYVMVNEKIGVRRKAEQTVFAMRLRRLVPGIVRRRLSITDEDGVTTRRCWFYELPELDVCRAAFEESLGQQFTWGEPDG